MFIVERVSMTGKAALPISRAIPEFPPSGPRLRAMLRQQHRTFPRPPWQPAA
jgi:hypothetical protein